MKTYSIYSTAEGYLTALALICIAAFVVLEVVSFWRRNSKAVFKIFNALGVISILILSRLFYNAMGIQGQWNLNRMIGWDQSSDFFISSFNDSRVSVILIIIILFTLFLL